MNNLPKISVSPDFSQFIYALAVVILVPILLAFNTIFLLRNVQKDMDYELNNKALMAEKLTALYLQERVSSQSAGLQPSLDNLVKGLPEIKAVEVFTMDQDNLTPLTTTSPSTTSVADPTLNHLAWSAGQAYSKQIYAAVGSGESQRIWLVAAPIKNSAGQKIGLVNLYLSAAQIDAISNSTTRDSMLILIGTMVVVLLLLLNHFRFFEISILFKKLSEIDKLKDDFISMASHELKGPITVINSYASVLLDNTAVNVNPEVKRDISVIAESTKRLRGLVDEVLEVTRIEQKRLQFNTAVYDLREIVAGVVEEFTPEARNKSLQISYLKPENPLPISCDREKMHQVVTNLVSNAVKYSFKGEVNVGHQTDGKIIKTFIKDSGIGISEENRKNLFNKFFRAKDERIANIYGTGLGLWITKQMVEKMGGTITVESIEDQGSQFTISFPLEKGKLMIVNPPTATLPISK